jgi:peptidoglycan/LPS O-acetylase OafA/YrhL
MCACIALNTPRTGETSAFNPELDGIRGLAIVGVLCSHGVGLSGRFDGSHNSLADKLLRYHVCRCGGSGSLLCDF